VALELAGRLLPTALDLWVERRSRGNLAARVFVEAMVSALRRDLAGDGASALEQLLVDRLICCWLSLEVFEIEYLEFVKRDHTRAEAKAWLDRVAGAQSRFQGAVKSYALARKLSAVEVISRFPRQAVADGPR
jgi:hypothetical protein